MRRRGTRVGLQAGLAPFAGGWVAAGAVGCLRAGGPLAQTSISAQRRLILPACSGFLAPLNLTNQNQKKPAGRMERYAGTEFGSGAGAGHSLVDKTRLDVVVARCAVFLAVLCFACCKAAPECCTACVAPQPSAAASRQPPASPLYCLILCHHRPKQGPGGQRGPHHLHRGAHGCVNLAVSCPCSMLGGGLHSRAAGLLRGTGLRCACPSRAQALSQHNSLPPPPPPAGEIGDGKIFIHPVADVVRM